MGLGCLSERNAEEDRKKNHLKNVVGGRGFEKAFWDDVFENTSEGDFGGRDTGARRAGRRQGNTHSGLEHIHSHETNGQSQGGDDLEVEDGFPSESADRLEVFAVAGDADHQCSEDQGHQDALDHLQEHVRHHFEVLRLGGVSPSQQQSAQHGDEDPMGEGDAPQESGHAVRRISRPGPGKQGRRQGQAVFGCCRRGSGAVRAPVRLGKGCCARTVRGMARVSLRNAAVLTMGQDFGQPRLVCPVLFQAMARQMATAAMAPARSAANPARMACRVRRMPMEPK